MAQTWTLERIGVIAGSITAIGAVIAMAGFSLSPPWASAGDLETVQKSVQETQKSLEIQGEQLRVQGQSLLIMQREYWRDQKEQAQQELRANPNSVTIKKRIQDAQDNIDAIDRQIKDLSPHP